MNIGKAFKTIRETKGLQQKYVAMQAGISQQHLSDIERNTASPRPSTMNKLCAALDVSAKQVFFISIFEK